MAQLVDLLGQSAIQDGHFYNTLVFKSNSHDSINDLINSFDSSTVYQKVESEDHDFFHLQVEIPAVLGEQVLLRDNLVKGRENSDGDKYYRYDMYMGEIKSKWGDYYFASFPYKKMEVDRHQLFESTFKRTKYFKPKLEELFGFLEKHDSNTFLLNHGLEIDIARFLSSIDEFKEGSKKMILEGENPVKSKVLKILYATQAEYESRSSLIEKNLESVDEKSELDRIRIKITHLSITLEFFHISGNSITVKFDIMGNYKFWIKKGKIKKTVNLFPLVFQFLQSIDSIEEGFTSGDEVD
ncbi:hypothetical protein [Ekhidna sp. To15]|uniref:hypothetical protein n=1 Tax=Ekhidna sp. To15 TaxID=3395267 RepID=UPI003F527119